MRSPIAEEETYVESGPVPVVSRAATTTARLKIESGTLAGDSYDLEVGATVIGRGLKADLRLDDVGLSRTHARIVRAADGTCKIEDLRSTNGTFVNDHRVDVEALRDGDVIRLAGVTIRYALRSVRAGGGDPTTNRETVLEQHQRAVEIREHQFGPEHPAVAPLLRKLARAHLDAGDVRHALEAYERARKIYESLPGGPAPELVPIYVRMGEAMLRLGQAVSARPLLMDAERNLRGRPDGDRELARARFALARVRHAQGDPSGARELAVAARDGFAAAGPRYRAERDRVSDWIIAHGG